MELNILANGEIGARTCVTLGNLCDCAELVGAEDAVGQGDAHHEVRRGLAFAARAADCAGAVALGVDAPPFEIETSPFGEDRVAALSREFLDFVEMFPGVLRALEELDFLGLR